MPTELLLAAVMVTALVLYALMAGADFGGGVWDLLASGPRQAQQRTLIEKAIGPIWEANHVWLILVVVVLFGAFPSAFSAISIALHIPLTLFLVGVVFRGSAFTFRAYDAGDRQQRRWGLIFSLASVMSPVMLGMMVGALASGRIRVEEGVVTSSFFYCWVGLFPLLVGLFALALFAFLAAIYLANEAPPGSELAEDFRARALGAGAVVGSLALCTFLASFNGAPLINQGLTQRPWTWPLHAGTAVSALAAFWALWRRRFTLARFAGITQGAFILLGWTVSQYPYIVVPDITLQGAASNPRTQSLMLGALAAGSVLLFPSLYVLYRIFKGKPVGTGDQG